MRDGDVSNGALSTSSDAAAIAGLPGLGPNTPMDESGGTGDEVDVGNEPGVSCLGAVCNEPVPDEVTLTFAFSGAPSGQVAFVPGGGEPRFCSAGCDLSVARGTSVIMLAMPLPGGMVRQWSDASCGNERVCVVRVTEDMAVQVEIEVGFNVAFVTSQRYAVTALPRPGAAANAECARLATAAGVGGESWVAWLAADGPTIALDDDINPIEGLQHTGGWVRTDGAIVAQNREGLRNGEVIHAVSFDESRRRVQHDAWTGANFNGLLDRTTAGTVYDCVNWTSVDPAENGASSQKDGLGIGFAGLFASSCVLDLGIMCFQDDSDKEVPIRAPSPSRLAFLATTEFTPGAGIAAVDGICQREACGAGLTGSADCTLSLGSDRSFKAYMHTDSQLGWQRFDLNGPAWVRPDGVTWVRSPDLGNDGAGRLSGLSVTLDLEYRSLGSAVWVGDGPLGHNCNNWTSTEVEGRADVHHDDSAGSLTGSWARPCVSGRIYCLEE